MVSAYTIDQSSKFDECMVLKSIDNDDSRIVEYDVLSVGKRRVSLLGMLETLEMGAACSSET
jgi:hypothetical protein